MSRIPGLGLRKAGRRTNVTLLLLLGACVASGVLAFGIGTVVPATVVTAVHAVAGFGVLLLVPWKQAVIRRGLRRPNRAGRLAGVVLMVLVPLALATGFLHSFAGFHTYLGLLPMQVHVAAALGVVAFAVRHALVRRQRLRGADLSKRSALRALALTAAAGGAYAATEGAMVLLGLPGRTRRGTGSFEVASGAPELMPVTQWLADPVPDIDANRWKVWVVTGTGARRFGVDELSAGTDTFTAVLDCTGGWYAAQRWRGVRLDRLLPPLDPTYSLDVVSVTGYRRRFPATDAARLLLATHVADQPLSTGHGAPVRLVAPGRRGFWWVKWVSRIEVLDVPWWWQIPAPLR